MNSGQPTKSGQIRFFRMSYFSKHVFRFGSRDIGLTQLRWFGYSLGKPNPKLIWAAQFHYSALPDFKTLIIHDMLMQYLHQHWSKVAVLANFAKHFRFHWLFDLVIHISFVFKDVNHSILQLFMRWMFTSFHLFLRFKINFRSPKNYRKLMKNFNLYFH